MVRHVAPISRRTVASMPDFRVLCYEQGIWDNSTPRTVEAATKLEAAEITCGSPLIGVGGPRQLRAKVWKARSTEPEEQYFYAPLI